MIYIFAILGFTLHWTGVFDSATKKVDFSLKTFFKLNRIKLLFDLVIIFVVVYNKDSIYEYIPIVINDFSAFWIGYCASDIGHRVLKKFKALIKND